MSLDERITVNMILRKIETEINEMQDGKTSWQSNEYVAGLKRAKSIVLRFK